MVHDSFKQYERIDVIVSNAGYGLFGCVEELNDEEINHIIATNLVGSIQLIKTAVPYLRRQGGGRIIQMSTYGAQVTFAANSMYHATKFGIEGFCILIAYFSRVENVDFDENIDAVASASVNMDGSEVVGNAQLLTEMAQEVTGGDLFLIAGDCGRRNGISSGCGMKKNKSSIYHLYKFRDLW